MYGVALLNLGDCYETTGKIASAYRAFLRAADVASARDDVERRREAERRAAAIAKDVSTLVVHVPATSDTSNLEIRLDGERLTRDRWERPVPVDAGVHELAIASPPRAPRTVAVTVGDAGARVEWTWFEPHTQERAPEGPDPTGAPMRALLRADTRGAGSLGATQRTLGLVTGAAGLAGLATGALFGVVSLDAHSNVLDRCSGYPVCPASDRAMLDELNNRAATSGTISTIGFIVGAAVLVGGATLFFTAPTANRAGTAGTAR